MSACCLPLPLPPPLPRGNHESSTCTRWYGFRGELEAKYKVEAKVRHAAGSAHHAN